MRGIFVFLGVLFMLSLVSAVAPTISNSYGVSKWDTTTARLNGMLINPAGAGYPELFRDGGLSDPSSWTETGHAQIAYNYIGFWNPDESFSSPRDAGSVVDTYWTTSTLSTGVNYTCSFGIDNVYSSVNVTLTIGGKTFSYPAGTSGTYEVTFVPTTTAVPVFSSPADAVGDGSGSIYAGFYAPISCKRTSVSPPPSNVTIYWGNADGGTNKSRWNYTVNKGVIPEDHFETDLTGLTAGNTYYYRTYANNSDGETWANATRNWTQLSYGGQVVPLYDIQGLQSMKDAVGVSYKLMNNINATETRYWTYNMANFGLINGFIPLGRYGSDDWGSGGSFTFWFGSLDGQGYKITDLYIDETAFYSYTGMLGVYGAGGGVIKDLMFVNATVKGLGKVGVLTSENYNGKIFNVAVINSTTIGSTGEGVGGLCGSCVGVYGCRINNSYTRDGNVTSGSTHYGGLVGMQSLGNISAVWSNNNISGVTEGGGLFGSLNQNPAYGNVYLFDSFFVGRANFTGAGIGEGALVGGLYFSNASFNNYWFNNSNYSTRAVYYTDSSAGGNLSSTAFINLNDVKGNSNHSVFNSWNFTSTWRVQPNDFPHLWFEFPILNITLASNNTLNYTAIGKAYDLDKCWYTINGTRTNLANCQTNATPTLSVGLNIIRVYANNTMNYTYFYEKNVTIASNCWTKTGTGRGSILFIPRGCVFKLSRGIVG